MDRDRIIDPSSSTVSAIKCDMSGKIVTKDIYNVVPGPGTAFLVGTAPPTQVDFVNGIEAWEFAAGADDEVMIDWVIPRGQKLNSVIIPRVSWSPITDINAHVEVCWALEYTIAVPGQAFSESETIRANGVCTGSHVYEELYLPEIPATLSGAMDVRVKGRLYRDVSEDTYTAAAAVHSVDLLIVCDGLGSTTATEK